MKSLCLFLRERLAFAFIVNFKQLIRARPATPKYCESVLENCQKSFSNT
jgi:hypothetical protein